MLDLLTPAEMTEADRLTIAAGTPGIVVMERAGLAVADAVSARQPPGSRVLVLAGPGNNGGDGFVAARILAARGFRVRLMLVGEAARLTGDALAAARRWSGAVEPPNPAGVAGFAVVIDALFGAGLDRPVEGIARHMIEAVNAAGANVIAVDLPSGINGASGAVMGAAIRAARTVTFFRRKPGHLLLPGRLHGGVVTVADIGIPASVLDAIAPTTRANEPALWRDLLPAPRADAHKYARGHAVIVSGGAATTGAARLAARAALRAGAGLVTIASPAEAMAIHGAANLAVMTRSVDGPMQLAKLLADRRFNAVLLGPGGGVGPALRDMVLTALSGERAVVLDADALTSFAGEPELLFVAVAARTAPTVLTPHDGEFGRLFGLIVTDQKLRSKVEKTRASARQSGAIILLKGADTVVADPTGRVAIAANAPPWLASAGTGDVLAGMIAALLAQGMPGFEAACAAVWLHGAAAERIGPGLISEDLPEALPGVLRDLIR